MMVGEEPWRLGETSSSYHVPELHSIHLTKRHANMKIHLALAGK